MSSTRLTYLFYRCFDGLATVEEENELKELLAQPGNEEDIKSLMEESWETFHSDRKRIGEDRGVEMLREALRGNAGRVRIFTWPRVAAAVILLLAGTVVFRQMTGRHAKREVAVVPVAKKGVDGPVAYTRQYQLPDGSKVILHAGGHIDPVDFSGNTREVNLTGEAYFDIVRDGTRPFIIHTGGVKTTVLGTAFNIAAYPEAVVVSVTEGKVKVENGSKLLAVLEPDQQVTYTIAADRAEAKKVDAEAVVTGWTQKDMIFEGNSFAEVADVLSRRFSVPVEFRNPKLKNCMVKAYFNGTESLEKVLEVLCIISNAHYTKGEGDKIVIDGPGCG